MHISQSLSIFQYWYRQCRRVRENHSRTRANIFHNPRARKKDILRVYTSLSFDIIKVKISVWKNTSRWNSWHRLKAYNLYYGFYFFFVFTESHITSQECNRKNENNSVTVYVLMSRNLCKKLSSFSTFQFFRVFAVKRYAG